MCPSYLYSNIHWIIHTHHMITHTLLYEMHVPNFMWLNVIVMANNVHIYHSSCPIGGTVPLHHLFHDVTLFASHHMFFVIQHSSKTISYLSPSLFFMLSKEHILVILVYKIFLVLSSLICGAMLLSMKTYPTSPYIRLLPKHLILHHSRHPPLNTSALSAP